MSENLRQSLSAMMDGEADEFEVRRSLQQIDEDGMETWSRYQLASALLKGEKPDCRIDLSSAVMSAVADEPEHKQVSKKDSLWKPLSSMAVAASVTAMVIFGAQNFQGDAGVVDGDLAVQSEIQLPGPTPATQNFLPAQYGNGVELAIPAPTVNNDIIRLSYGMEHYINQHHSMLRAKQKSWNANWLPDGFSSVRHEVMPDSEVMIYSDGRTAISVSVEPYGKHKSAPGAVQSGDTVALGKRVGDQFVTVVGDLPLMIADRIASSVDRSYN
jgi:hypothetical protein